MPLSTQEGQELTDKADAVGNSIAAGEGAAKISDTIEAFKSAVATMTEPSAPIQSEPTETEEEAQPQHEAELETVQ